MEAGTGVGEVYETGIQSEQWVPPGSVVGEDSKRLRGKGAGDTIFFNRTRGLQGAAGSSRLSLDSVLLTIDLRGRHVHLYPTIPSKGHLQQAGDETPVADVVA